MPNTNRTQTLASTRAPFERPQEDRPYSHRQSISCVVLQQPAPQKAPQPAALGRHLRQLCERDVLYLLGVEVVLLFVWWWWLDGCVCR